MPNPDRNLFFEHQGLPTHKRWQDGYSELSLKVYRAFDRVQQAFGIEILDPSARHALVVASQLGDPCVIDFRYALDFELWLDVDLDTIIFVAPTVPRNRTRVAAIMIKQVGAAHMITNWTNAVFLGPAPAGTPPTLTTTVGATNSLVARINGTSQTLRFICDETEDGFPA
jgi:hypothetical protein